MLVKELAHRNLFLQHVGRDLEPLSSRNGNRVLDLRLGGFYPVSTDGWVKSLKAWSLASSLRWMSGLWNRSM